MDHQSATLQCGDLCQGAAGIEAHDRLCRAGREIETAGSVEIRRLDTLRGLTAVLVVVGHDNLWTRSLPELFGIGQWGLMLFFLLSAFLMTVLYLPVEPTPRALRNCAVARIARVVPLSMLVVVASFVMCGVLQSSCAASGGCWRFSCCHCCGSRKYGRSVI